MRALLRLTAVAGIAAAFAAAGPAASAFAATPGLEPASPLPVQIVNLPTPLPLFGEQPGGRCQSTGLLPGIPNLGPTGPLGPLGPDGPLGASNLPCGASAFNLGPTGPLGPSEPLGPGGLLGGQY
jgi:hypothetical protein